MDLTQSAQYALVEPLADAEVRRCTSTSLWRQRAVLLIDDLGGGMQRMALRLAGGHQRQLFVRPDLNSAEEGR